MTGAVFHGKSAKAGTTSVMQRDIHSLRIVGVIARRTMLSLN
ncbi:MAG: hypothetical protein ACD_23C00752G0001 [uncultured bacterium]|nr:MAG: hypothetical protein ACD_23C00752G0001 [uncultured bacterium]